MASAAFSGLPGVSSGPVSGLVLATATCLLRSVAPGVRRHRLTRPPARREGGSAAP
ncbi:hypothetical protein ACFFX0_14275 [Citricoccus parietis]|uniref:Uncharacterized protein n=1 Tax=Citricoccus parietis TaxID=592307 RepID=A0ABV5G036_9MICC